MIQGAMSVQDMSFTASPLLAALLFGLGLAGLSYLLNRRVLGDNLTFCPYSLALTASAVFTLAITAETLVNPLYTHFVGRKLWEYHALPLHDANVSALAIIVWTAYGVHLYFFQQTVHRYLPQRISPVLGTSLVVGIEAPFVFEVMGNSVFLLLTGKYYAFYLPDDVFHFTSLQVIPIYMICIAAGIHVITLLGRYPKHWLIPTGITSGGLVLLSFG